MRGAAETGQLEISGLTVRYGSEKKKTAFDAVRDISFTVGDSGFGVIVGPSGCGKTTVLKAVAGTKEIAAGKIVLGGRDITKLSIQKRRLAFVSQNIVLYPNMTVYDNIAMPLRAARVPLREADARIRETADLLEIGLLLSRRPGELSGGQQQRAAIARAVVKRPSLYLFDEPFSSLDPELRDKMRHELKRLHRMLDAVFLFVTHDRREAMMLADRLIVMNGGRIEQSGDPLAVFENPANEFVKKFLRGTAGTDDGGNQ